MAAVKRTNWAANIAYTDPVLHEVTSVSQIQALLRSHEKVKPAGTGHTFNSIADTPGLRLALHGVADLRLDASARTVTISAGVRYDQLCPFLDARGFALANMASILDLSVAGACSTAAHGSGDANQCLATAVAAFAMVTGEGEILTLSRDADADADAGVFSGAVVGLGALGVITELTLDVVPTFPIRQWVYENLEFSQLGSHFDAVLSCGYSVSLFTDLQSSRFSVWVKSREQDSFAAPETLFGAHRRSENTNMNFGAHVELCTDQMGVPGPPGERLPHFKAGFLAPVGKELQSEYFVPRQHAVAAISAVQSLRDEIAPHLFISEIRSVAGDGLWLSPCYGRDSVAIAFTWRHHEADVRRLMPIIEEELAEFDVRAHWGKMFAMAPAVVQAKYEKLPEFRALMAKFDPNARLRNEFLDSYLFSQQTSQPSGHLR